MNKTDLIASIRLFIQLARGKMVPDHVWKKKSFRRKFIFRSLLMPRVTIQWLNKLSQLPEIETLLIRQPRLPVRLHRPYLAINIKRNVALHMLCAHYEIIYNMFSSVQYMNYLSQSGLSLAKFSGKDGSLFQLDLVSLVSLDKEGESTLVFRDEQMRILAEITFTFCFICEKRALFIGGLQGSARDVPHEVIQLATKSCHGLFPKRIVMEALCQLAQLLRIERILAVSNDVHIYRCWRYRDKEAQIYADYDIFWSSLGGNKSENNYFSLPLLIPRKNEVDIASKKRAEYRRRYALLDNVIEQVCDHIKNLR